MKGHYSKGFISSSLKTGRSKLSLTTTTLDVKSGSFTTVVSFLGYFLENIFFVRKKPAVSIGLFPFGVIFLSVFVVALVFKCLACGRLLFVSINIGKIFSPVRCVQDLRFKNHNARILFLTFLNLWSALIVDATKVRLKGLYGDLFTFNQTLSC